MRLLSPDDACTAVTVPIGRERSYNGTTIEVSDPSHVNALRQIGYTVAGTAGTPVRSGGYRCGACGFQAFFKVCGRCGGACRKDKD